MYAISPPLYPFRKLLQIIFLVHGFYFFPSPDSLCSFALSLSLSSLSASSVACRCLSYHPSFDFCLLSDKFSGTAWTKQQRYLVQNLNLKANFICFSLGKLSEGQWIATLEFWKALGKFIQFLKILILSVSRQLQEAFIIGLFQAECGDSSCAPCWHPQQSAQPWHADPSTPLCPSKLLSKGLVLCVGKTIGPSFGTAAWRSNRHSHWAQREG